jgi:hypothetical protein
LKEHTVALLESRCSTNQEKQCENQKNYSEKATAWLIKRQPPLSKVMVVN